MPVNPDSRVPWWGFCAGIHSQGYSLNICNFANNQILAKEKGQENVLNYSWQILPQGGPEYNSGLQ